jgi:hypothetical protein
VTITYVRAGWKGSIFLPRKKMSECIEIKVTDYNLIFILHLQLSKMANANSKNNICNDSQTSEILHSEEAGIKSPSKPSFKATQHQSHKYILKL